MKTGLRRAMLFAVYTTVAWSGDLAAGLVADEVAARFGPDWGATIVGPEVQAQAIEVAVPDVEVQVPEVVVEVKPSIASRVRVRRADPCTHSSRQELVIPVEAAGRLEVRAGSGALDVEGREGLQEVVVVGLLCASDAELLEGLDVRALRRGADDVLVETTYPRRRGDQAGRRVARIDLTILVPGGLAVDIDDSSGHIVVEGTGALSIDDSSGDIRVRQVWGDVRIDDSSGSLDVEAVSGTLAIEDGSGGIDVRRVGGSLYLRDGSGGIEAASIEGDVVIERDGSGGIDVRDVGGDFVVEEDGSGGIRHAGVDGRVDLPRKKR